MSYAADSSKRKFHRILESISTNDGKSAAATQTHSGPTVALAGEAPPKRARLASSHRDGAELAIALARNGSLNTLRAINTSGSTVKLMTKTMAKTRLGDQVTPYAPTMRDEFLLRLKTFSIQALDKWSIKPECLNEVEWAKRGWVLEEKETVRCTYCSHRHVLRYNEQEADLEDGGNLSHTEQEQLREIEYEAIATKWATLIVNGHSEACPWRIKGCDATIYRLPVNHPSFAMPQLKARYESILTVQDKLPTATVPDDAPIDQLFEQFKLVAYGNQAEFSSEGATSERPAYETHRLAFTFALLGWEMDPKYKLNDRGMLICKACFRRLGLWLWHKAENESISSECPVADEHRIYCPWIDSTTQNEGAAAFNYFEQQDVPAWQQLARFVMKAGKSPQQDKDMGGVDGVSDPDASLPDKHQSMAGNDAADPVGEGRPNALEQMAAVRAKEAQAAETRAAEDRSRTDRWQRLKQKLALNMPKKLATKK